MCRHAPTAAIRYPFEIDDFRKYCLLNGLDDIGLTLRHADKIRAFEERHLASPALAGQHHLNVTKTS